MKATLIDFCALAEVLLEVTRLDLAAQISDDLKEQYAMRESVELALEALQAALGDYKGPFLQQLRAGQPPRDP